jgi:hypothetical protein
MEQGKRYIVTGWHTLNRHKAMQVWVAETSADTITAHMRLWQEFPTHSTQVWSRDLASQWTWLEVDPFPQGDTWNPTGIAELEKGGN